ncbi:MAG: NAD(P)H-dependent oxidoreductase [Candidatus Omnitrophica bacterium]|nr:NAD(P)H-dependent oxidoreductase [Candidatus Omnitrophota bacterium]
MKYLIIYAHPNPKSFNAAIKEQVVSYLKSKGKEVVVRDLYQLGFNPTLSGNDFAQFLQGQIPLDIKKEQELIGEADTLIIIHPIWWFNLPAILKGYIDRVFSHGFAYKFADGEIKGLLTGKNVIIINTTGGPQENYENFGYKDALKLTICNGIFAFCGMSVKSHKFFYAVPTVSNDARTKMLEEIKALDF